MWIRVGANSASRGFWLAGPRTGVITFSCNITTDHGIDRVCIVIKSRESGNPGIPKRWSCATHTGLGGEEHEKLLTLFEVRSTLVIRSISPLPQTSLKTVSSTCFGQAALLPHFHRTLGRNYVHNLSQICTHIVDGYNG